MPWKRPVDVPSQVWRRFQGRGVDGEPVQYEIRDAEEKDWERCVAFLTETFLRDEPLCQALDILSEPDSVSTIQSNWRGFLQQGVSLACHCQTPDGRTDLAAVAIGLVCSVDDEEDVDFDRIKGEPWKRLLRTLLATDRAYNVFKRHSVDQLYSIHMAAVAVDHRGRGLGLELFRASEDLARALDLKFITAVCTAVSSQHLAAKCRFKQLAELSYSAMLEQGIDLSRCSTSSALVMGKEL